jgi:MFS family permease
MTFQESGGRTDCSDSSLRRVPSRWLGTTRPGAWHRVWLKKYIQHIMGASAADIQRVYLGLTFLSTLAASFIWGINTLFLLDAGLNNTEAFAANAFFTLGQVIFEIPTGVVADIWGRRTSYLLGALTLLVSTLLYYLMWKLKAPFWGWALSSVSIGLGFTFFSGATEAWLVDAMRFAGYQGELDPVFARGTIVGGAAMLGGSVAGGYIAQVSNLGVPYLARSGVLGLTFLAALLFMKDLGFQPDRSQRVLGRIRTIFKASIDGGLRRPPVRWVMLAAPFAAAASFYAFYAMQPYLLKLYGNPKAYSVAGLAAAFVAGAQIAGGLLVKRLRRLFARRTQALIAGAASGIAALLVIGWTSSFWLAVSLLVLWAMANAAVTPIRQTYLNGLIPSEQRATILSFDSLMGSAGAAVAQPVLGRIADAWSYSASYLASAAVQLGALPFLILARRERAPSDTSA